MSKNITIKEGGTSRSFTAEKLRTNLQGGGTCDWVPLDEIDQYVELEELAVTENGFYYPQSKVGFSRVSVDVQGGGDTPVVPSGTPIRGTASENLTAGDCVYIIKGGEGGTASVASAAFSGYGVGIACDGTYVYFRHGNYAQGFNILRVPISNLTATPEVYKELTSSNNALLFGNIIYYSGPDHIENLKTGATREGNSIQNISHFSQHYFYIYYSGYGDISSLENINNDAGAYGNAAFIRYYTQDDFVLIVNTTKYRLYRSLTQIGEYTTQVAFNNNGGCFAVVDKKLIVYKNTATGGYYEVGYFDLTSNDGVFHNLKDKDGNNVLSSTKDVYMNWNDTSTILVVQLGSKGIALVYTDLSVVIYTNITGVNNNSVMFGDYFYDNGSKILYHIPQGNSIGRTNDKNHAGSLGFVQVDIPAGAEGNAIEMFR